MIQYLIIGALLIWSCVVVFNKLLPKTANTSYHALADGLHKLGWRALANKVRPKKTAAGCAGGCGCSSNDAAATPAATSEIKRIKWK
jgi:hypothetical protein